MHQLDDIQHILSLDTNAMHKAIKDFPLQLHQGWIEATQLALPDGYKDIDNIVVCGMGSAALCAEIITDAFSCSIPFEIIHSFSLPHYANNRTLVIISSNSGNTEETLSCAHDAIEKHCKIIGISTGGKIKEILVNYPMYIYDEKYNPSGQSRLSLGYTMMAILAFLSSLDLVAFSEHIDTAIESMNHVNKDIGIEIRFEDNHAKKLAAELHTSIPFLIGAGFLTGAIHSFAYQINENAKKLSAYFVLPEMNHHLLEGLGYEQNKGSVEFVFFDSELFPKRIRHRIDLTHTIIQKNNFKSTLLYTKGDSMLSQLFSFMQFSAYVSFYMAILANVDPSPIPWVNFLNKELELMNAN